MGGCPKKTWWDCVKNDRESLGLSQSQKDAQFRNKWRRRIWGGGQLANPGSPGKMAVKTEYVCVYTVTNRCRVTAGRCHSESWDATAVKTADVRRGVSYVSWCRWLPRSATAVPSRRLPVRCWTVTAQGCLAPSAQYLPRLVDWPRKIRLPPPQVQWIFSPTQRVAGTTVYYILYERRAVIRLSVWGSCKSGKTGKVMDFDWSRKVGENLVKSHRRVGESENAWWDCYIE